MLKSASVSSKTYNQCDTKGTVATVGVTGAANDINQSPVRCRALINTISNTCVSLRFHV